MLFTNKTVDSVMAVFTRAIADLELVAKRQKQEASNQASIAVAAAQKGEAATLEAERAEKIIVKLSNLIGE